MLTRIFRKKSCRPVLPCKGCAYRVSLPGNTHSRCVFDWLPQAQEDFLALIRAARITERTAQWFRFPFNFDPVWGPDHCPHRAETRDPVKVAPPNPFGDFLSLLP